MPKKDIDYSKMCIYKIVCNDCNVTDLYIGSTTEITKRRSRHKYNCNNPNSKSHKFKIYEIIRNNGGWDNWNVVVIEYMHDCLNGEEARTRERQWFELLNANLNTIRPIVTVDEIKDETKERCKQYRDENIQKCKQYRDEHKDENNEKSRRYYNDHKAEMNNNSKQYYENHKEDIKQYRDEHKEQNKIQYHCECGASCSSINRSQHNKSVKHIKFMESKVIIA
jgi:hypothetical protein